MIPLRYIEEWRQNANWIENIQVEQDLIITRALIEVYSDAFLAERLAFRGGTALHKLFVQPPARYSEDIDLVAVNPAPIGEILDHLRKALSFIEGAKVNVDRGDPMTAMYYRFLSEDNTPGRMRLKIEINCREHITVFGHKKVNFEMANSWFTGSAGICTYELEELLGTKLRALYQRRKGRDLFDLWYCLAKMNLVPSKIIHTFHEYIHASGIKISRAEFLDNMEAKIIDTDFRNDVTGLLSPDIPFDMDTAYNKVKSTLLEVL